MRKKLLFTFIFFVACSPSKEPVLHHSEVNTRSAKQSPINQSRNSTEEFGPEISKNKDPQTELKAYGNRWLYGPGFGRTAANVGTTVAFPPYAIYLLANAGLQLAGFRQLYITDALPETPRGALNEVYAGITSVPGRLAALIAGKKYRAEKVDTQ